MEGDALHIVDLNTRWRWSDVAALIPGEIIPVLTGWEAK
jgi:hypothetical protein